MASHNAYGQRRNSGESFVAGRGTGRSSGGESHRSSSGPHGHSSLQYMKYILFDLSLTSFCSSFYRKPERVFQSYPSSSTHHTSGSTQGAGWLVSVFLISSYSSVSAHTTLLNRTLRHPTSMASSSITQGGCYSMLPMSFVNYSPSASPSGSGGYH
jgi:hypothetical protein